MNILFVDTVTSTGQWQWALGDLDPGQPSMIRVAALLSKDETVADRVCRLVTPLPGKPYVTPAGALLHGIDTADLMDHGVVLGAVLARMAMLIARAELIVGHNIDFHTRVLRHAFGCGGVPIPELPRQFCTMRKGSKLVGARGINDRPKLPRLAEAYAFFAGEALNLPRDPIEKGGTMVDAVRVVHRGIMAAQPVDLFDAPPPPAAA